MPWLSDGRGGKFYTGSPTVDNPEFGRKPVDYSGCLAAIFTLGAIMTVVFMFWAGCGAINEVRGEFKRFSEPYLNLPGYRSVLACNGGGTLVVLQSVSGPNPKPRVASALQRAGPEAGYRRADDLTFCPEQTIGLWDSASRHATFLVFLGPYDRRADLKAACTRHPDASTIRLNGSRANPKPCGQ